VIGVEVAYDDTQDPQAEKTFHPIRHVSTSGPGLKPNAVHFFGLLANSVGFDAPEVNSIATIAIVITFVGVAVPSTFVFTVIGGLSFAVVIARFSRVAPSAAGLQEFIRRGLGDIAGDFGAVAYVMGMGVFISGSAALTAITIPALLQSWFSGSHDFLLSHWFVWIVVVILVCATLAYLGVEISSRVMLLLSGVGIGSIVVLDLAILVRNGLHGLLWSSLLPWHSTGLPFATWIIGLGLAFSCIAGPEGAVFLAEEAGADNRTVGRAVISCVTVVLALYLLTSFAYVSGLSSSQITNARTLGGMGVVQELSTKFLSSWYGTWLLVILAIAATTASLAIFNAISRLIYSFGREGKLPRIIGATHSRHRTPYVAISILAVVNIGLAIVGLIWKGDSLTGGAFLYPWVLLFGIVLVLVIYGVLALAALRYEWQIRTSHSGAVRMVWAFLPGLVMLGFCAICLYSQIHPAPPPPYNQAPFVAIGWLVVSALAATWWKVRAARSA
jgi:amino acid transporter